MNDVNVALFSAIPADNCKRYNHRTCGVTKLDRVINERIRGSTKVGEISKKQKEVELVGALRRKEHDGNGSTCTRKDEERETQEKMVR